jgi:hypothetical protein
MTVNEYLNSFIQLSRYAPDDINTDEKEQDMFLNGLNDDIQFQLLNTDYADFQHVVDKAIIIENKIKEMEKDGKRKVSFHGQPSGSNVRPRFSQPNQFFKPLQMNRTQMSMQMQHPQFQMQQPPVPNAKTKCSVAANITADEPPGCTAAATIETTIGTPPHNATYAECAEPRRSRFGALFQVWHEWSSLPTMPQQAVCYWSRKPVMTSRVVELHLWQG